MAPSSVVRIGPNDSNLSAQLLRNAITSFFRKTDGENKNATDSADDSHSTFVIRNKYFNANIALKNIKEKEEKTPSDSKEDGIILVFDAVRSNPDFGDNEGSGATFDSLESSHKEAISKNDCGDLLRLCVGVSLSEVSPSEIRGKDHEKEFTRRILWCLDNGYEYVEADLSEEGRQKGHDDRDKDGFARVIEAIEGTVWSSAEMSASKSTQLKDSIAESKAKIEQLKANDSSAVGEDEEGTENEYVPPDPSLLASNAKSQPDEMPESAAALFGLKEGMQAMEADDMDTEKLFSQMESVLKEAAHIRKEGKNFSDEERRERAGNAALALVNLMGQFGLDDEDSDEYNSDDSGVVDAH